MLTWWRRRKDREQQVIRDADNLMALLGDGAYAEASIGGRFGIKSRRTFDWIVSPGRGVADGVVTMATRAAARSLQRS